MSLRSLAFSLLILSACSGDKVQEKGLVDDSTPPELPPGPSLGKADDASQVIAINVESDHPYANNANEEFVIDLEDVVPSCAFQARLHFASLQVESTYDFVHVVNTNGQIVQSLTGDHGGQHSVWIDLEDDSRVVSLVLESDSSIVRHGFRVDEVEWAGAPICPAFVPTCPAGQVDINPAPSVCECPPLPTCVDLSEVSARHATGGGFAGSFTGTRVEGTDAYSFTTGFGAGPEVHLGTVNAFALRSFVRDAAYSGVLAGPSVSQPANWSESFSVAAGEAEASYLRAPGTFSEDESNAIAAFDALMVCGPGRPLSCAPGLDCVAGSCVAADECSCSGGAPVCGIDNRSYASECEAECAGTEVKHQGECGIVGDTCGGFAGFTCQPGHKCRYGEGQFGAPFPDASGLCVEENYCDFAGDCVGLPHIAVPGAWSCQANQCLWQSGPAWQPVLGWGMETPHPYGNDISEWKQLYAPDGANSVRLEMVSPFELEDGYDFLEVWSWNGSQWFLAGRFTGTEAEGATYEFGGQYHYLHFVSDFSVGAFGFELSASYSSIEI